MAISENSWTMLLIKESRTSSVSIDWLGEEMRGILRYDLMHGDNVRPDRTTHPLGFRQGWLVGIGG